MKRLQKFLWPAIALVNSLVIACGSDGKPASLPAPPPAQITAQVDKAAANPGDVITFTLKAEYDKNAELELPEIADKFSDFRIVGSGGSSPEKNGDRISIKRWYKIQADIAGSYVVEPVEVAYHLPQNETRTLKTPKIFIQIESLLKQDEGAKDIRDIKPPVSVSPGYKTVLPIAAVLAAIVAALILGKWSLERYRLKRVAAALASKPAHEEAIEAVNNLLLQRLIEQGRIQEFYFRISYILRRYLERRFAIPAVDFTREEILTVVDERDGLIDGEVKPALTEFLVETDLVKFAKRLPAQDEIEKLVQRTITFIEKTAPIAAQEAAGQPRKEQA